MFKTILSIILICSIQTLASPDQRTASKAGAVAKHPCLILSQTLASDWARISGFAQLEGLKATVSESVLAGRMRKYEITFHVGSPEVAKTEIFTEYSDEQQVCYFSSMRPIGKQIALPAKHPCLVLAQQVATALAKTNGNATLGGFNMKTSESVLSNKVRQYNIVFQMGSAEIEKAEILTEYSEETNACQFSSMRMH